jgi:hypothetical protein
MDPPWHGLSHCPRCNALHTGSNCSVCGHVLEFERHVMMEDGKERVVLMATQGAIPWSVFVLLQQIRVEQERPLLPLETGVAGRPAQRLVVVLLFWTLFETLMDGFFRAALADLPGELADELLLRFSSVGARLDRLYRRIWGVTFWKDMENEGFAAEARHLREVQASRNAFVHGDPEAINDALVDATFQQLTSVQQSWIVLFNKRCTGRSRRIPLWVERGHRSGSDATR